MIRSRQQGTCYWAERCALVEAFKVQKRTAEKDLAGASHGLFSY